jgi:hypothetical protein
VFEENKNGVVFNNDNLFSKAYIKDCEFDSTANSGIVIESASAVENSNFEDCSFTNVNSDALQINAELQRSKIEGFTVQGGGLTRFGVNRVSGSGTLRNVRINDIITDEISQSKFSDVAGSANGILHTIEGLGYNSSNDPRSAGDWNGNGREGVEVLWTDGSGNRRIAKYADSSWSNQSTENSVTNVSSDVSTSGEGVYIVDSSGAARTLTLSSADAEDGNQVSVKRNGANTVTVDTEGSETIDDATTQDIQNDDDSLVVVFNASASNWEII